MNFTIIIVLWEHSIDWFTSLYNSQLIKYKHEENKYFCFLKQYLQFKKKNNFHRPEKQNTKESCLNAV